MIKIKKSKPTGMIVATDRGFLCNGEKGSPVMYRQLTPYPCQIRQWRNTGQKSIDRLLERYGKEKINAVFLYPGDDIACDKIGLKVVRSDGREHYLYIPDFYS